MDEPEVLEITKPDEIKSFEAHDELVKNYCGLAQLVRLGPFISSDLVMCKESRPLPGGCSYQRNGLGTQFKIVNIQKGLMLLCCIVAMSSMVLLVAKAIVLKGASIKQQQDSWLQQGYRARSNGAVYAPGTTSFENACKEPEV